MIIFQKDHIKKSDTVIHTTADLDCHLFQNAHSRRSLTGVEHMSMSTHQFLSILTGHCSDTAHTLHHIQHQTFRLQQRLHFAFYHHHYITRFHFRTVIDKNFYFHCRVKAIENFFRYFNSGQYTGFFNQQFGFPHCSGGDT